MKARVLHFRQTTSSLSERHAAARRILETPVEERVQRAEELGLESPEVLLSLCDLLRSQGESSPSLVRDEAEFLYGLLSEPGRKVGLFDERDYFLGETALLAGAACRMLFRRSESRRWLDRADASFRHTISAKADLSRVTYQRLALKLEERALDEVLEFVPSLVMNFQKLGMAEDALKTRFLEGVALMNTDRLSEAADVFRDICEEARQLRNERLFAIASNNLIQIHGLLGQSDAALAGIQETLLVFRRLNNRVGIAKLQWGLGTLLRTQGQIPAAIEAYRASLAEFAEIGMRSDVAALHLILGDLLLEIGQETPATVEILAALPVIENEEMVPEGMAALALLRESIRRRTINRQALRDLHGYFEEIQK
jgi:tetratricopeptide (TPR) repeat protein